MTSSKRPAPPPAPTPSDTSTESAAQLPQDEASDPLPVSEATTSADSAASAVSTRQPNQPSYVVAIGASAGGLDPLEKFFAHMPCDTRAAFVVIQHLSPDHKSIMQSLLARYTQMPIKTVTQNMELEPNSVYLIPAGSMMHVDGNRFLLSPKYSRALSLPIDVFFQSLAANYRENSIGVVLSGTGSDGTRGASAINAAGGLLLAQDPEDAKFDGMPRSVISTGLVDAILPIEQMAERICAHVATGEKSSWVLPKDESFSIETRIEQAYQNILRLLHQAGGINFIDYKPGTVSRRIERRMAVRQINSLDEYFALLNEDASEVLTLRRELLIPVTSFFRDQDAYEALKQQVVDVILAKKAPEESIRVWCAGVSTGEEPYSIAMLFLEAFEQAKHWPNLKVFATDVEQLNIDAASSGVYPESIVAELQPQQLERFFSKRGNQYVVKNELRQCIVFAKHNLLADPPFTKMDLVVCRNVLIYFTAEAQQRVLRRLQYALKPEGFMFLGSSESLGSLQPDFSTVSHRQKIWKLTKPSGLPLDLDTRSNPTLPLSSSSRKTSTTPIWENRHQNRSAVQHGFDTLLRAFTPPAAILVGPNQELLHSYGDVQRFLQFRAGQPSLEIPRILPDELVHVATALLFKSMREGASTTSDIIRLNSDAYSDEAIGIRLSAWPVHMGDASSQEQHLTLLVFEEVLDRMPTSTHLNVDVQMETSERLEVLQHELAATRESLQATIEELETSNEELQATNEEMMASNEELQSSNEELQSVNEELNTVNAEYQEKIDILNRVNADLDNLAKVVATGTIFIDEELNLTRFSQDATKIFKLRNSDIGRPLSDISHILDYNDLSEDLRQALNSGDMLEKDVSGPDGQLFLVKMLPYKVSSSNARGLVINFIDITSMRKASKLQEVLDASLTCMAVLDFDGQIQLTNKAWINGSNLLNEPNNPTSVPLGANYLGYCLKSQNSKPWAKMMHEELSKIISGTNMGFQLRLDDGKIIVSASALSSDRKGILLQIIPKGILTI